MNVWFFQALVGLIAYDLVLLLGKFKAVHGLVRHWKVAKPSPSPALIESIAHAVNLACVCYPKQVLCLQRSSVTTCLMRHHGLAAEMVLGAQKTPFAAHAWVEIDGRPINEKSNVKARYNVWERC